MRSGGLLLVVLVAAVAVAASPDGSPSNTFDLTGRIMSAADVPSDPFLAALYPAELEVVDMTAFQWTPSKPGVLSQHRGPYSRKFYQSLPDGLMADNLTAPGAPPVFAVIGDAMGALGFQMCDIEHYMDHANHTLPPCPPRAGWASKVAAAYDDRVWLVNHMIRSTNNAAKVSIPLIYNQFDDNTSNLKLVVLAFGSKYTGLNYNFTQHLAGMTESLKARGIRVVLMSRPPVNPTPPAPLFFDMYNTTVAAMLADAVRTTAAETGVPCLDVYNLFLATGDRWTVSTVFPMLEHCRLMPF